MINVAYHPLFDKKDLPALSPEMRNRVRRTIETKILVKPAVFGKPLRTPMSGHWSMRVGNYRIIYEITPDKVVIYMVEHRAKVYELARRRLGF